MRCVAAPVRHVFLTADWIAAARRLRDEVRAELGPNDTAPPLRINLVVTDLPFDDHGDELLAHVATTDGIDVDTGHIDDAQLVLQADYDTIWSLAIQQDQAAVMRAFFESRLKVEGDLSVLLSLQSRVGEVDDEAKARVMGVATRLRAITVE